MAHIDHRMLIEAIHQHIEFARSRLEDHRLTEEETAMFRGRIQGCRFVIEVIEKAVNPPASEV